MASNIEDTSAASLAPRGNLSLPRELRDYIYDYLIDHENVRGPPFRDLRQGQGISKNDRSSSRAPTYGFHLQILGVNKEIRAEALEVLERNRFIVVSYVWPSLGPAKHLFSVPVVTEDQAQVARFRRHVMRLHIQRPPRDAGKPQMESFLMLAADLPAFCQMLHWIFCQTQQPCTFVTRLNSMRADSCRCERSVNSFKDTVTTKIQLQPTMQDETKLRAVKSLLEPFNKMIGVCQKVVLLGFDQYQSSINLQVLRRRMCPRMVWTTAMAWHMLDTVEAMQCKADDLALKFGDYEGACQQYKIIWSATGACLLFGFPDETYDSDLALPMALVARAMLDILTNWGFLQLRLGHPWSCKDTPGFGTSLENMNDLLERMPQSAREIVMYSCDEFSGHLGCWHLMTMCLFLADRNEGRMQLTLATLETITRRAPDCQNARHDLNMLRNIMADPKHRKRLCSGENQEQIARELNEASSACVLAPKIYHASRPDGCNKPLGLDGFVDMGHLKLLAARPDKSSKEAEELSGILRDMHLESQDGGS